MKVGDEVYAVESSYAITRHGFIVEEHLVPNSEIDEVKVTYKVVYDDSPCCPFISCPESGEYAENEVFKEKSRAIAYANYVRREV